MSAETAERVEPSWLAGARGDGLLLRALEPGSSPIPPPEAVEGHELAAYVPASLRDHLAVASGEAEHRQVTVAFVKATGTDAADDDPEAMSGTLDTLASAAATACERYGLTWLESDIDADAIKLYLTGGAPATTGHDEESMLRALRDVVESEIEGLTLRAGVNRGRVFTGDIGSRTRRTYAVMGDAVNLAARLVARARPGTILVTSEVLDRAWTAYATETEPLLVKGKEAAIMAHTLGSPTGTRRTAAVDVGPIVGRAAELEVVADAVQRARSRELQLLEVVAEPGMGKSRLISEAPDARARLPAARGGGRAVYDERPVRGRPRAAPPASRYHRRCVTSGRRDPAVDVRGLGAAGRRAMAPPARDAVRRRGRGVAAGIARPGDELRAAARRPGDAARARADDADADRRRGCPLARRRVSRVPHEPRRAPRGPAVGRPRREPAGRAEPRRRASPLTRIELAPLDARRRRRSRSARVPLPAGDDGRSAGRARGGQSAVRARAGVGGRGG